MKERCSQFLRGGLGVAMASKNFSGLSIVRGMIRIRGSNVRHPFIGIVRCIAPGAHDLHQQLIRAIDSARRIVNELRLAQFPFGEIFIVIRGM